MKNLTIVLLSFALLSATSHAAPLKVCATTPDLGSLAREVGGDEVSVVVFAKGAEDPHFVEARPSFVKDLSTADLYLQMGLELEIGWAPVLVRNSRNAKIQPGTPGFLDCSRVIAPIDLPTAPVDRSQGDVHPAGNPHYLLDPVNGLKVARLIRDRLAELRPAGKEAFTRRCDALGKKICVAMIGEKLAEKYGPDDVEPLMKLHEAGRLDEFLKQQGQAELLGGWIVRMKPHRGVKIVTDHNMWNYFARRFGLEVVENMEPKPGLPPTTKHLTAVVEKMKTGKVKLIVHSPYFDERHAAFLAKNTGAAVVVLAHQTQAVEEANDYTALFEYNVGKLARALGEK